LDETFGVFAVGGVEDEAPVLNDFVCKAMVNNVKRKRCLAPLEKKREKVPGTALQTLVWIEMSRAVRSFK